MRLSMSKCSCRPTNADHFERLPSIVPFLVINFKGKFEPAVPKETALNDSKLNDQTILLLLLLQEHFRLLLSSLRQMCRSNRLVFFL